MTAAGAKLVSRLSYGNEAGKLTVTYCLHVLSGAHKH